MKVRVPRTAIPALFLAAAACGVTTPDLNETGTVRFIDVEGGCWTIEADDTTYEPMNLPAEMREDGLEVEFVAMNREDMASICMVGRIIELVRIEEAD